MVTETDDRAVVPVMEVRGVPLQLAELGDGPPLLFLHGLSGVDPDWPVLTRLAETHRVLVPTHPGFGLTDRPDWLNSVDDLAYLYLDLLEQLELRDVRLVGASLGGWVAAEMAVRSQERIGDLVLIDPVGIKVGDAWTRDIADIFALDAAEVARRSYAATQDPLDVNALSDAELLARVRSAEATVVYGWEPYMYHPKLRRRLGRIARPTLVAWGESDGVVTVDYGRAFADAIPGSRFVVIADAGHHPHLEQPDELLRHLHTFATDRSVVPH